MFDFSSMAFQFGWLWPGLFLYRKHGCCHVVEFFFYFQLRVCFFQHLPNLCNIRWTILLSASWWKSPSMQDGPCISGCRTQSCLTLYSGKPPGILNKGCWSFKPCNGSNLGVSDAFLQAFPMWLAKLLLSNLSACKPVHIGVGNTMSLCWLQTLVRQWWGNCPQQKAMRLSVENSTPSPCMHTVIVVWRQLSSKPAASHNLGSSFFNPCQNCVSLCKPKTCRTISG